MQVLTTLLFICNQRERVFLEIHAKLKEELNECKTENLVLKNELNMKDDIISKLEKENESLKNKVDNTYMTLIEHSDKTYNTFFEKVFSCSCNQLNY